MEDNDYFRDLKLKPICSADKDGRLEINCGHLSKVSKLPRSPSKICWTASRMLLRAFSTAVEERRGKFDSEKSRDKRSLL